jgi:Domain of unknown function (DUF4365)
MSPYPRAGYTASIAPGEGAADRSHWQEWFSFAFIQSIATACGFSADVKPTDTNQMDILVQTLGLYAGSVRTIALQVKSTHSPEFVEDDRYVVHDLEGDRYNRLLDPSNVKRFFVIVAVPPPPTPLVSLDCDVAHLQAAGWWDVIEGERTSQGTKRVRVPTAQRFDADGLQTMLTLT